MAPSSLSRGRQSLSLELLIAMVEVFPVLQVGSLVLDEVDDSRQIVLRRVVVGAALQLLGPVLYDFRRSRERINHDLGIACSET